MTQSRRVVTVLAGDGVGPEVTAVAVDVLREACRCGGVSLSTVHALIGGCAIDEEGVPVTNATITTCRSSDAVVLGAVGGPRWDHIRGEQRCEAGVLRLRKALGLYANVRPTRVHPALAERSPVRAEIVRGTDLVIVRELTGGAYYGLPKERTGRGANEAAVDSTRYTRPEIERILRFAFELARQRRRHLTSVDKANVLMSSQLWRDIVNELAEEYADVRVDHQLVDSCTIRLIRAPTEFDVIVADNLFGDILSDEAGVLAGSLGMLPSASVGASGPGLYEPVHGSAPDIAGEDRANPLGAILSVALALRMSLHLPSAASAVEQAVDEVIAMNRLTPDVGGTLGTRAVGRAVIERIPSLLQQMSVILASEHADTRVAFGTPDRAR